MEQEKHESQEKKERQGKGTRMSQKEPGKGQPQRQKKLLEYANIRAALKGGNKSQLDLERQMEVEESENKKTKSQKNKLEEAKQVQERLERNRSRHAPN